MNPELVTRLTFNKTVILEITNNHDSATLCISDMNDKDSEDRCVTLLADEIDLLIATLTLCKGRIIDGGKT